MIYYRNPFKCPAAPPPRHLRVHVAVLSGASLLVQVAPLQPFSYRFVIDLIFLTQTSSFIH